MTKVHNCLGALALELSPGTQAKRSVLDQAAAGELAALIARDLAKIAPGAASLDLALVAALFDPVELLRPHWPLHRELERLIAQAPDVGEPRVIAFAGRNGDLPDALRPQADFADGALRLVPLVLRGATSLAREVDAQFEQSLLDIGMAGADTALQAQHAFGAMVEHARYLTVHDLAAMMAMQYDNVGLGAVWPLIEAALLTPGQEQWLDSPPEPLVRLSDGAARIAMMDDEAWAASKLAPTQGARDQQRLSRGFDRFQMRQRQIAALLEAHGIATTFDHCAAGQDAREILCR
jgi:hypothetical protein